jgi:hypothetical protein
MVSIKICSLNGSRLFKYEKSIFPCIDPKHVLGQAVFHNKFTQKQAVDETSVVIFCQNHPAISANSIKPIKIIKQLKASRSLSFRSIFHYLDTWTCLFSRVVLLATSCRHTQVDWVSEGQFDAFAFSLSV